MTESSDSGPINQSTTSEPARPRFTPQVREQPAAPAQRHGTSRETLESVVIAFVLAFLFRTFEAEAFVIPTGSMAPTLLGRHKDAICQECGWTFTVGFTEEQGGETPLTGCVCPNCRFTNRIADNPVFKGDRILVLKALYDLPNAIPESFREPKRWDVVVFKFPEEPQINYIKRLVGLPNEELHIHYGNVFTRTPDERDFHIARKPPRKQQVMRIPVFDNNHQSAGWKSRDWPARWQPDSADSWRVSENGLTFESIPNSDGWASLTYHNFASVWSEEKPTAATPREAIISDFYAYNAGMNAGIFRDGEPQPHWVGDLSLDARVEISRLSGQLRFELVEAGERFVCEFDLDSGGCQLFRQNGGSNNEQPIATAKDVIRRAGSYRISFTNFDDRLTVQVGNRLIFGDGHDYDGASVGQPQRPTEADLRPASIRSRGAPVHVSDLVLFRDIYYTHGAGYSSSDEYFGLASDDWEKTLSTPERWGPIETAQVSRFAPLGPEQFMMCGDNSPRSKDGRLWDKGAMRWLEDIGRERGVYEFDKIRDEILTRPGGEIVLGDKHVVHRQLLIGKAFFVYWPHAVPFGPEWLQFDINLRRFGTLRVPFYPNVAKMKMIE